MTNSAASLLPSAFGDVEATLRWPVDRWEMLIRQARRADVLATLAARLRQIGHLDDVPQPVRPHLESATIFAAAQERDIRREVAEITECLGAAKVRPVLLKGAAYLIAGLPVANGRVFSDVDLLVPRDKLAEVEAALMMRGWVTTHHNAYDQRYYRKWMHELPPMRHMVRQTVLDVHHGILPLTARFRPDPSLLLSAAVSAGEGAVLVLAPIDMLLHSATHLLCNEEFSHGFRDLLDLDGLMRYFSAADDRFWAKLLDRAGSLDLTRVLYYAMRYCAMILDTPIPQPVMAACRRGEPVLIGRLMDALFVRALRVDHPTAEDRFCRSARRMLYIRGHWLRMPPHLLAYHLTVKAFRKEELQAPA